MLDGRLLHARRQPERGPATSAKFTLTYWAMEGFAQVLWAGNTFVKILPTVGILLAITAGMMAIAIWRFNRGNLFD